MKTYQYCFICAILLTIASNTEDFKSLSVLWALLAVLFFVMAIVAACGNK